MNGEKVAGRRKRPKRQTLHKIPHSTFFDLYRLNPTKYGFKKIKMRFAVFPSVVIRVHPWLKFRVPRPSRHRSQIASNRAHACLKK